MFKTILIYCYYYRQSPINAKEALDKHGHQTRQFMQQSYITEQVSAGYRYILSPYKDYIDRYTSLYKKKKNTNQYN